MKNSTQYANQKSFLNKEYAFDSVRTHSIMICTSKTRKKKLVHIKDCLSELKIQGLIPQHKPLKTKKTNQTKNLK